jgi:hypothetical protein
MRCQVQLTVLFFLSATAVPSCAVSADDKVVDQQSITELEARISHAQPREQCFLYAQLIHQMTEFSLQQYAAGDVEKAGQMLVQIQQLAHKIHLTVNDNDKRLKNAEILLRHTAFRLREMLHSSSAADRPLVEETLAQVDKAETDAMMQVFRK